MANFARIIEGVAVDVAADPTTAFHSTIAVEFVLVPDQVGPQWRLIDGEWQPPPEREPPPTPIIRLSRVTKRAFQERFPRNADGVSTKFDTMSMFLNKDSYAETLVADAQDRTALQLLITTGLNRINASAYVDLALPDATMFTALLLQPSIPAAFRLTPEERAVVLNQVVAEGEAYAG